VGEGRNHERCVQFAGSWQEIRQIVHGDKANLAVCEHDRFRPSRGSGGEKKPAGIIVVDSRILERQSVKAGDQLFIVFAATARPDADCSNQIQLTVPDSVGLIFEFRVANEEFRFGFLSGVGRFGRCLPEIAGDPNRSEPKGSQHDFDHLVGILRLNENTVALLDPELRR